MSFDNAQRRDFTHEAEDDPPPRRRRTGMACVPCRRKKSKCDGLRPSCGICLLHSTPCTYQAASQMVHVSREYITRLRESAEAGERLQRSITHERGDTAQQVIASVNSGRQHAAGRSEQQQLLKRRRAQSHSDVTDSGEYVRDYSEQPPQSDDNGRRPVTESSATQDMRNPSQGGFATHGHSLFGPPTSSTPPVPDSAAATTDQGSYNPDDFHGGSSALSFMHAVQSTINSNSPPDAAPVLATRRTPQKTRHNQVPRHLRLGIEAGLPQRSLADDLVGCYFRNVHILFPFVHRPTFEARYERTWTSGEQQDDEWLALLNVIFAMGVHFAYGLEDSSKAGDRFFGYAQKLVSLNQFTQPTLQTLQLLLLSGLYCQSTSRPNQCWNVIGLAIRVATTIGAHVEPNSKQSNPIQSELRRRCWYGCFVLDSLYAANFGRPSSAPSPFGVGMPANLDDEYITEDGRLPQPVHVRPKTSIFIHYIGLCKIMQDVLPTLYPPLNHAEPQPGGGARPFPRFQDAIGLDHRLVDWLHSMPDYLRDESSDETDIFRRPRNVLLARFLDLRILIHRPFTFSGLSSPAVTEPIYRASLETSLHSMSVTVCRSVAIQLVEIIRGNFYQGLSSAWWIDLNYLFSAASVLLALELEGQDHQDGTRVTAEAYRQALVLLGEMRGRSPTASSYISILEAARDAQKNNSASGTRGHDDFARQPSRGAAATTAATTTTNNPIQVDSMAEGLELDDYWQEDLWGDLTLDPCNIQDLFRVPWHTMAVDNPMPTFE